MSKSTMALTFMVVLVAVIVSGCSENPTAEGDVDTNVDAPAGSLLVRAELPDPLLLGNQESTVTVEVSGADIDEPVQDELVSSGRVAVGTITVPSGSKRTITMRAFHETVETHRGSTTTDILPEDNPTVRVTLQSLSEGPVIEATIGSGAVVVTPLIMMCPVDGVRQFSAEIQDVRGQPVEGAVTWMTSDDDVASVTGSGLVTISGSGEALITATSGTQEGVAKIQATDAGLRDITFFVTGDPQVAFHGAAPAAFGGPNQEGMIDRMNDLPGQPDRFCGLPVEAPRFVLVAGDLTQNAWSSITFAGIGKDDLGELDKFVEQWGLNGDDGLLHFPVMEGYGNHDDDLDRREANAEAPSSSPRDLLPNKWDAYCVEAMEPGTGRCTNPVINEIRDRNLFRDIAVNVDNVAEGYTRGRAPVFTPCNRGFFFGCVGGLDAIGILVDLTGWDTNWIPDWLISACVPGVPIIIEPPTINPPSLGVKETCKYRPVSCPGGGQGDCITRGIGTTTFTSSTST